MMKFQNDNPEPVSTSEILVIGLGGAGTNIVNNVCKSGLKGAKTLSINADLRTLEVSNAATKLQLGVRLRRGLACGGDPELGLRAAQENEQDMRDAMAGHKIVFLCVGLGGGTGSGAAPLITRIAREQDSFIVVFATMPFAFEGNRRRQQSETSLNELAAISNALVTFDNGRMAELVSPDQSIHDAFDASNGLISLSISSISRIALYPGIVHIGLDDLITTLSATRSRCLFGTGSAKGAKKVTKALEMALKSPLIDKGKLLASSEKVLVHICGGPSTTMIDANTLMDGIVKNLGVNAEIFFGISIDKEMADEFSVTIISSLPEEDIMVPAEAETAAIEAPKEPADKDVAAKEKPKLEAASEKTPTAPANIFDDSETKEAPESEVETASIENIEEVPAAQKEEPKQEESTPEAPEIEPLAAEVEAPVERTPEPPAVDLEVPTSEVEQTVESVEVVETVEAVEITETIEEVAPVAAEVPEEPPIEEPPVSEVPAEEPVEEPIEEIAPTPRAPFFDFDASQAPAEEEQSFVDAESETATAVATEEEPVAEVEAEEIPEEPKKEKAASPIRRRFAHLFNNSEKEAEELEASAPARNDVEEPDFEIINKENTQADIESTRFEMPTKVKEAKVSPPKKAKKKTPKKAKKVTQPDLFGSPQGELELDGKPKGRFEGEDPNIFEGDDLDIPTFLRNFD